MKFLYCHGFASSPQSRKATIFRDLLSRNGIDLEVPALDAGDFEHLTISGQLQILDTALDNQPCVLIGSSMGGYLAALYASLHSEVDRLVLLAPAFDFAPRWQPKLPPNAPFEVYHYGEKRARTVHYGLIEDALAFPPIPDFRQPAFIFHGINDEVVPIDLSREYAAAHPNVRLRELESDHELLNVLQTIAAESAQFLGF